VGGYLTTAGNPLREDLEMLRRAGFSTEKQDSCDSCLSGCGQGR
jgi:biotin synthase-like enzyme